MSGTLEGKPVTGVRVFCELGPSCPCPLEHEAITAADVAAARRAIDKAGDEALMLAAVLVQSLEHGRTDVGLLRDDLAAALADYRAASDRYAKTVRDRIAARGAR